MTRLKLSEKKIGRIIKGMGYDYPPKGFALENLERDNVDTKKVMAELGSYLAKLHSIKTEGFGPVDEKAFNFNGKIKGSFNSWGDYWATMIAKLKNEVEEVFRREEKTKKMHSELSSENRTIMKELVNVIGKVEGLFETKKDIFKDVKSRLLNGNIHLGSIIVSKNDFIGLNDFGQMVVGDPVDDLAYFSVMPKGEELLPNVLDSWNNNTKDPLFEEKLHLYRLLESYRKIIKRYVKYKYLQKYPEPLIIAQKELVYYNIK